MDSYTRGPDAALSEQTIHETLASTARRFPDRDALIVRHEGVRYTWSQLAGEVERTARGIAGLGLSPGDRIGVWATNCAEWLLLQYGASRAGVILVNINPAYRSHELEYVLRKSHIRTIFLREADDRANYREILAHAMRGQDLPLAHTVFIGSDSWVQFLESGVPISEFPISAHEVANIQYTSGTTGSPKGVLLTHRNVVNNGRFIGEWLSVNDSDRICIPVPLYHCFGCVIGSMVAINTGAAMVLPGDRFHALPTMEAVQEERCTLLYGVPTMFIGQLNHPDFSRFDFTSLRGGVMAGAPCPVEIMKRVMREMHCPGLTIVYGQTESAPVITGSTVDDSLDHRAFTVGCAFPGTEVKVVNRETGATVPRGEVGEVCTRGYLVMKGYDADPDATREAIDDDGWLHTGDLAVMRDDGYLHLTGRAKDVIIRGGENVYPKEVENFLHEHPAVANVEVVGVPDVRLGEAVAAWIILKPGLAATAEEIRAFCEGEIAHFKIPHHVRFVESFPTTVTGKTQKFLIRQREIELLGLDEAARVVTA
jgi:fatty-acyl-CoA synthase